MKEISQEVIEIDGKEYTLFLNRKGIVAFEKYCKEEKEDFKKVKEKFDKITSSNNEKVVIDDNTNPFEDLEDIDDNEVEKNVALVHKIYVKLYWIMLYENHKLSLSKVEELYNKAVEIYGDEQVQALGDQMVEEVNIAPATDKRENLKNLAALKPKK